MIYKQIKLLVKYALDCGLIEKGDEIFCINRLLEILGLDGFEDCEIPNGEVQLESVLGAEIKDDVFLHLFSPFFGAILYHLLYYILQSLSR